MSDLRNKLIRLAHQKPELREHLLPLLKKAEKEYDNYPSLWEKTLSSTLRRKGRGISVVSTIREAVALWKKPSPPHPKRNLPFIYLVELTGAEKNGHKEAVLKVTVQGQVKDLYSGVEERSVSVERISLSHIENNYWDWVMRGGVSNKREKIPSHWDFENILRGYHRSMHNRGTEWYSEYPKRTKGRPEGEPEIIR